MSGEPESLHVPNGHSETAEARFGALAGDLGRVCADVRFDAGTRALFSTDASKYREPPIGVVFPRDRGEVLAALEVCRAHGAPLLP